MPVQKSTIEIIRVASPGEIQIVQELFREYWDSFGFTPCFQDFSIEVAELPGKYAPPAGRLALAMIGNEPAGCVAFRRVDHLRCEAKRLYVRNQYRGRGIGRELLSWLITEARRAGYEELVADTMPVMAEALAMYERFGFRRTGPYAADPTPSAVYLGLKLRERVPPLNSTAST